PPRFPHLDTPWEPTSEYYHQLFRLRRVHPGWKWAIDHSMPEMWVNIVVAQGVNEELMAMALRNSRGFPLHVQVFGNLRSLGRVLLGLGSCWAGRSHRHQLRRSTTRWRTLQVGYEARRRPFSPRFDSTMREFPSLEEIEIIGLQPYASWRVPRLRTLS